MICETVRAAQPRSALLYRISYLCRSSLVWPSIAWTCPAARFLSIRTPPSHHPGEHTESDNPWADLSASASPSPFPSAAYPPPSDALANIRRALETHDTFTLTRLLLSIQSPSAVLTKLPSTTFSILLQTLDPTVHGAAIDPAHGILIPAGLRQFSPVGQLNNSYGVRHVHLALFPILLSAFESRLLGPLPRAVLPDDYRVLLRCAGACQDVDAVQHVWRIMDQAGHRAWRAADLFTEFIQARFLTLPIYYQHDRARVRVRPADLHRSTTGLPANVMQRLDSLRASINHYRWLPHGILNSPFAHDNNDGVIQHHQVDPSSESKPPDATSVSRFLRAQGPVDRVWSHALGHGAMVDEKLFCAGLIARSRTGARVEMKSMLRQYYGIRILENWDVRGFKIVMSTARHFDENHPRRPTEALLHAVVDAFSAAGDVRVGIGLAVHISARYSIAIPHSLWSSIIQWAYISGSKPFTTEWKLVHAAKPHWRSGPLFASQIESLFAAMTESLTLGRQQPISHSWDDINIRVRSLIESNDLALALDTMLLALSHYDTLLSRTTASFHALTCLAALHPSFTLTNLLHAQWQKARLRLDLARNDIRLWLAAWFSSHSRQAWARSSPHETHRLIPKMVLAFRQWLPFPTRYRTATGTVRIYVQGDPAGGFERAQRNTVQSAARLADEIEASDPERARHSRRVAEAVLKRINTMSATRPAGRTVPPGQEIPVMKTVFVQPPPTMIRQTTPGRADVPGKGRKTSEAVQPWIQRGQRIPWMTTGGENKRPMVWMEPVSSGDVEEDLGLKGPDWVRGMGHQIWNKKHKG